MFTHNQEVALVLAVEPRITCLSNNIPLTKKHPLYMLSKPLCSQPYKDNMRNEDGTYSTHSIHNSRSHLQSRKNI